MGNVFKKCFNMIWNYPEDLISSIFKVIIENYQWNMVE